MIPARFYDSTDRRTRLLAMMGMQYTAMTVDAIRQYSSTRRARFLVLAFSCTLATLTLAVFSVLIVVMTWTAWHDQPARELVGATVCAALANLAATVAAETLAPRGES